MEASMWGTKHEAVRDWGANQLLGIHVCVPNLSDENRYYVTKYAC
jgi:hypothetical protein